MIIALILGSLVGFVLALPPGPVAVMSMKLSLDKGLKQSVTFGTAAGLMDFIYGAFALFSTQAVFDAIGTLSDEHPYLQMIFQAVVIAAVLAYGIVQLRRRPQCPGQTEPLAEPNGKKFLGNMSGKGPFLLGVAIALANVVNPTFLPTLMYVMVYVRQWQAFESDFLNNLAFAAGFGLGNFLWLFLLGRIMNRYRNRMSEKFMLRIYQFAGVTLIGFGTMLGYKVFFQKIPDLLKLVIAF